MKKIFVLFFPLILITLVLTIVHVIVSNKLSTAGVELDVLQADLIQFKKENTLLRTQVLVDTSLTQIASSAAELGFVDAKASMYLPDQIPLALR